MKRLIALISFCILSSAGPLFAQESNAARWILNEQVSEGCSTGQGSFSPDSFVEIDLTGDGRDDLFVSHSGLRCASGRPLFCGAANCSFTIYVREGQLLVPRVTVSAVEPRIVPGNPPYVQAAALPNGLFNWIWNGREFVQTPG